MQSSIIDWTLERLQERSTWVGLTGLLTAIGVTLSPSQSESITLAGVALASAIVTLTKDD